MKQRTLVLFALSAIAAGALACSSTNTPSPTSPTATKATALADLPADGSTLKADPAVAVSPLNDFKMTSPVVVLTARAAAVQFPTATPVVFQYRFQVISAAGVTVENALVNGTTYQVAAALAPNARYTWRVRPEVQSEGGPWSATGSFLTEDPAIFNDPLTNGRTIGRRIGGQFVAGGWQSNSVTDGIDYDVPGGCIECKLVFDATNFGGQEGFPYAKDLKWVSMGDANAFGSFDVFRDHPWKMHLVQRADYPSGMEIIWRNGGTNANGRDPGDHRIKLLSTPLTFSSSQVYHFELNWTKLGYTILVNDIQVMADGWDHWYETPNLRIELGCIPRADSFVGIIYRNVKLTKK